LRKVGIHYPPVSYLIIFLPPILTHRIVKEIANQNSNNNNDNNNENNEAPLVPATERKNRIKI